MQSQPSIRQRKAKSGSELPSAECVPLVWQEVCARAPLVESHVESQQVGCLEGPAHLQVECRQEGLLLQAKSQQGLVSLAEPCLQPWRQLGSPAVLHWHWWWLAALWCLQLRRWIQLMPPLNLKGSGIHDM